MKSKVKIICGFSPEMLENEVNGFLEEFIDQPAWVVKSISYSTMPNQGIGSFSALIFYADFYEEES